MNNWNDQGDYPPFDWDAYYNSQNHGAAGTSNISPARSSTHTPPARSTLPSPINSPVYHYRVPTPPPSYHGSEQHSDYSAHHDLGPYADIDWNDHNNRAITRSPSARSSESSEARHDSSPYQEFDFSHLRIKTPSPVPSIASSRHTSAPSSPVHEEAESSWSASKKKKGKGLVKTIKGWF